MPTKLYVIADGPRDNHSEDSIKCAESQNVTENIDWPCEVIRITSEHNLGPKERISGGLNLVFDKEERAIILEDDCLAHPHFFLFCEHLLKRFEDNPDIFTIGGSNFLNDNIPVSSSYYYSKYNHCWGWATWRRAWQAYDGEITFWPEWKSSERWRSFHADKTEQLYWEKIFDKVYNKEVNSWAYPWTASVWNQSGLTITPAVNLVKNIGFGDDSTHTSNSKKSVETVPLGIDNNIDHPETLERLKEADQYVFNYHFGGRNLRFPRSLLYYPWLILNRIFRSQPSP